MQLISLPLSKTIISLFFALKMLWDALWYIYKSGHGLIFQGANFNTLVKIELAMEA